MRKPRRPRAQPTRQYPRTLRVNELVREIAADEIERLDDERLELVAITSVEVDPDLRRAVVWFDSLLGEAKDDEVLEALGDARVAIQAAIGRQSAPEADADAHVQARHRRAHGGARRRDPPRAASGRRRADDA